MTGRAIRLREGHPLLDPEHAQPTDYEILEARFEAQRQQLHWAMRRIGVDVLVLDDLGLIRERATAHVVRWGQLVLRETGDEMTGNGKVKSLKERFGFLRMDDGTDVFFLPTQVEPRGSFESMRVGQRVDAEYGPGDKGPRAIRVKVA